MLPVSRITVLCCVLVAGEKEIGRIRPRSTGRDLLSEFDRFSEGKSLCFFVDDFAASDSRLSSKGLNSSLFSGDTLLRLDCALGDLDRSQVFFALFIFIV